jgi:predicted nucleic acid-binding protein
VTALFDTSVLLDYLLGDKRAVEVFNRYAHRALSVITWVEVMSAAPAAQAEATRAFMRSFERLSISEAIADEALRLIQERHGLPFHRALTWATARVNQLTYVTAENRFVRSTDKGVLVPYAWAAQDAPRTQKKTARR